MRSGLALEQKRGKVMTNDSGNYVLSRKKTWLRQSENTWSCVCWGAW